MKATALRLASERYVGVGALRSLALHSEFLFESENPIKDRGSVDLSQLLL